MNTSIQKLSWTSHNDRRGFLPIISDPTPQVYSSRSDRSGVSTSTAIDHASWEKRRPQVAVKTSSFSMALPGTIDEVEQPAMRCQDARPLCRVSWRTAITNWSTGLASTANFIALRINHHRNPPPIEGDRGELPRKEGCKSPKFNPSAPKDWITKEKKLTKIPRLPRHTGHEHEKHQVGLPVLRRNTHVEQFPLNCNTTSTNLLQKRPPHPPQVLQLQRTCSKLKPESPLQNLNEYYSISELYVKFWLHNEGDFHPGRPIYLRLHSIYSSETQDSFTNQEGIICRKQDQIEFRTDLYHDRASVYILVLTGCTYQLRISN